MSELFGKGLAFGFVLAAAVGPMWVLCFRRAVSAGLAAGLASGLGIALADAIYGAIAAFGLTAVSGILLGLGTWLGIVGAAFLVYLGVRTLTAAPAHEATRSEKTKSLMSAFLSTLGLTLANPPTILAFAALFAGLGLAQNADFAAAGRVTFGVFLGSASWWVILVAVAGWAHRRVGPRFMRAVNAVSGASLLGFALWQLARIV